MALDCRIVCCLLILAIGDYAGLAVAAPLPFHLCHIPASYIATDRLYARHAMFAAQRLAPQYPELNVTFGFATLDGGPSIQRAAAGMLSSTAASCDALVGAQFSSLASAISPLVHVPWISHTATATALSDKEFHPFFSRMIPPDDFSGAGIAAAVLRFQ